MSRGDSKFFNFFFLFFCIYNVKIFCDDIPKELFTLSIKEIIDREEPLDIKIQRNIISHIEKENTNYKLLLLFNNNSCFSISYFFQDVKNEYIKKKFLQDLNATSVKELLSIDNSLSEFFSEIIIEGIRENSNYSKLLLICHRNIFGKNHEQLISFNIQGLINELILLSFQDILDLLGEKCGIDKILRDYLLNFINQPNRDKNGEYIKLLLLMLVGNEDYENLLKKHCEKLMPLFKNKENKEYPSWVQNVEKIVNTAYDEKLKLSEINTGSAQSLKQRAREKDESSSIHLSKEQKQISFESYKTKTIIWPGIGTVLGSSGLLFSYLNVKNKLDNRINSFLKKPISRIGLIGLTLASALVTGRSVLKTYLKNKEIASKNKESIE